jgi:hypothetical protein
MMMMMMLAQWGGMGWGKGGGEGVRVFKCALAQQALQGRWHLQMTPQTTLHGEAGKAVSLSWDAQLVQASWVVHACCSRLKYYM